MSIAKENWLESPDGKRARQWKRELAQVRAHAKLEPRSKNSITPADAKEFQRSLAAALGKRRGFRAHTRIMLELDFHATADNPPEIHTVAKNYIDLAYRAPVGEGRLFRDDRQINYLAVSYTLKVVNSPSIFVRAARMSGFREDIRFARELGDSKAHDSWSEETVSDRLDDLYRWENRRDELVARIGQRTFDAQLRIQLTRIQQRRLMGTERILHSLLLEILGNPFVGTSSEIEINGTRRRTIDLGDVCKNWLFSPNISLALAPIPQKHGEGEGFKRAIKEAISEIRAAHPQLFPLYTELAVVVLLVPPSNGSGIDLDNLALKIIPRVHDILQPPATQDFSYLGKVDDPKLQAYFEQKAKIARRLPKHHITRYEVVLLPRTASDPPEGTLRLVLCDGSQGSTFAQFVRKMIEQ